MRTLDRLRYPFRTRRRALLTVLLLAAVGWAAWYVVRAVQFDRAHAAAERALAEYDFPAAEAHLQVCARLRPRDPAVRLLAAQAARREGKLDEAETHLLRYRELAGNLTEEWKIESALLRVARGRVEAEIDYLLPLADRKEPRHPAAEQILEGFAVGCVHNYQLDRASFWVSQLLTHFPRNPVGRLMRAQQYVLRNRYEQAAEECRGLLADFPGFVKARLYLASALFKSRKFEEAVACYEELRRSRPGDVEVLLGLARSLDRLGRVDEARPLMRELEERTDSSDALLECGRFATRESRLADAERLLRRAVELAPNDHEVHYHLGVCLDQQGKAQEARQHLGEFKRIEADLLRMEQLLTAMAKNPRDPAPRREAGLICLRNGQVQEGLRWLHGVLETSPNDWATHEALANHYLSQGNSEMSAYHRRKAR